MKDYNVKNKEKAIKFRPLIEGLGKLYSHHELNEQTPVLLELPITGLNGDFYCSNALEIFYDKESGCIIIKGDEC